MKRSIDPSFRRGLAVVAVLGMVVSGTARSARAQTPTTIPGSVASQPTAPARIVSCDALVVGGTFTPEITFDSAASVKTSTVTFSFFDKSNAPLGKIDLSPPYQKQTLPTGTDTFTCAISHETLADGTVFPVASSNNTALVVGGIAGVGLIAALVGHGGSGSSGTTTTPTTPTPVTPSPTPTATSAPTATGSPTVTASPTVSPTATARASASPTATASASPIASASPTGTPTVSPSPTVTPTVNPSAPVLSTNPVDINGTGNTATTTVSETKYTGTFAPTSTCGSGGSPQPNQTPGPIASLSPAPPYANPSTITVTANEAGTCTVTFTDSNGLSVMLSITVTTSSVKVNGKKRVASPTRTAPVPTPVPGAVPSVPQKSRGTGRLS